MVVPTAPVKISVPRGQVFDLSIPSCRNLQLLETQFQTGIIKGLQVSYET